MYDMKKNQNVKFKKNSWNGKDNVWNVKNRCNEKIKGDRKRID